MTGRYWISSNYRGPQDHRTRCDGQVHPDFERVRLDHGRHPRRDRHVGEEVPQARHGAAAAGVDGGLRGRRVQQRVVARGQRVDQVGQHEANAFGVGLVQASPGYDTLRGLRGGEVGLHRAVQQRVARPSRVGEPAVPPRRLHLRASHGDAAQLAEQLAPPPGDQAGPDGQRSGQAQARAARVHPAQHARGRVGKQQVKGARRGVGRGWPGRIGVGAHYQPSPRPRGAFFHWSRVTNPGPGVVLRAQAFGSGRVGAHVSVRRPSRS